MSFHRQLAEHGHLSSDYCRCNDITVKLPLPALGVALTSVNYVRAPRTFYDKQWYCISPANHVISLFFRNEAF
ncbi:hypothetical protein J6590_101330 [Homalodisca vitripennis]|nr:hypothetical protein J6590_101330 [Homalodisca vitripennis]